MIQNIGQIAITVKNIEEAIAFYRDRVGLNYLYHDANVALFDLNGVRLLLGQAEGEEHPPHGTIIYYRVEEINAEFDRLKANGVKIMQEPHLLTEFEGREIRIAFLMDPDGNTFALISETNV